MFLKGNTLLPNTVCFGLSVRSLLSGNPPGTDKSVSVPPSPTPLNLSQTSLGGFAVMPEYIMSTIPLVINRHSKASETVV